MIKVENKENKIPPVPQINIKQPTGKAIQLCIDIINIEKELKKNNIEQKTINKILCFYVLSNK